MTQLIKQWLRALLLSAAAFGAMGVHAQAPNTTPIRIGSTLALTGPLSATAVMQKIAGEIYIEQLNKRGGWLGRPVEWVLKDDQSKPDVTRTLYEQLITSEKVDLIVGPYATGSILSAMGVAQRYNKVLLHNTFGLPALAKYDMLFSVGGQSYDIETVWPNLVFDAVGSGNKPPKSVAMLTSKFPSVHFVTQGAREVLKKRGMTEATYLEWEFGNRDFGAIAARVKEAKPDMVWVGGVGLDGNLLLDAMKKIDYVPPQFFIAFPASGPMLKSPDGKGVLALTVFEEHAPFTSNPVAAEFVKQFNERAAKAGLPDSSVELIAAVAYATWQSLDAAITATKSLDDKTIAAWLKKSQVDTVIGKVRWDGTNNFMKGTDLYRVKQVQNGKWQVVWPREYAAPGTKLIAP
ncbi:amino acid ABC transporter substrate-binding protein [Limnohabitans sp.]|uniref:amino acid ABC transporter substrate-binding protein n=1 Tax=Limnohabitans sp. TaxID=1907725 RepID=UPI0038B7A858